MRNPGFVVDERFYCRHVHCGPGLVGKVLHGDDTTCFQFSDRDPSVQLTTELCSGDDHVFLSNRLASYS